jgi:hypothetical protein
LRSNEPVSFPLRKNRRIDPGTMIGAHYISEFSLKTWLLSFRKQMSLHTKIDGVVMHVAGTAA